MRNIVQKPTFTDTDHKSNYKVIDQHIDDDYYQIDFHPSDFQLIGNATAPSVAATIVGIQTGNELISVIDFNNVSTSEIKGLFRSRKYWETGVLEFTVYYTGSASSTNTFQLSLRAIGRSLSEDVTGAYSFSPNDLIPGPSTAHQLQRYTFTTYLNFSREDEIVHFRLFRSPAAAGDTYAGEVYLLLLRVRLIPSNIQSGLQG